jgi:hypothetical protein
VLKTIIAKLKLYILVATLVKKNKLSKFYYYSLFNFNNKENNDIANSNNKIKELF